MIESYDLEKLLKSYELDANKFLIKNDNILTYGEYQNIKYVLEYLLNECKISPRNIEKCPSILYFAPQNIKENYEFLKNSEVSLNNIDTTLHILSTDPKDLKDTYNYILDNYGVTYLNQITSILNVNVNRIKKIENIIKDKNLVMSASISRLSVEEIEKVVKVCKANNIDIKGSVFYKTAEEIKDIVKVCEENGIKDIKGSVFLKTAEEIEKIIEVCKANDIKDIKGNVFMKPAEEIEKIIEVSKVNGIKITGSVFMKTAEEIEKIIEVCEENGIKITGGVFLKTAEDIQSSINYVKSTYGEAYLMPLIINKNVSHLQEVLPYLESLGVLSYVIKSASILTLTLDEIKHRKEFIEERGETLVLENGRFNSIFGMTKKKYENLSGKKVKL